MDVPQEHLDQARRVLRRMHRHALANPGRAAHEDRRLLWDSTSLVERYRPTRIILTLDQGAHACGWWRNSEYDRCLHLSVSHPAGWIGRAPSATEAPDDRELRAWAEAAFGDDWRRCWVEPPASSLDLDVAMGRRIAGVGHVRLFLDQRNNPIMPTGEVYTLRPFADGSSPDKIYR